MNVEFTICMCVFSSLSFLDHWHWCNWRVYREEGKSSFEDMWCLPLFLSKVSCLRLRDKQIPYTFGFLRGL